MADSDKTEQWDAMLLHMASQHEGGINQVFTHLCKLIETCNEKILRF